jgi:hypothetical protein
MEPSAASPQHNACVVRKNSARHGRRRDEFCAINTGV